ncbi:MAG: helix-hairpin-helix domain-containing protein [Acidobacteria bacterium]|nr:helix-hairpin-helix domain-containing protein [Acidobacteriota bacterium]
MTLGTRCANANHVFFIVFAIVCLCRDGITAARSLESGEQMIDWAMLLPDDQGKDVVLSSCTTCHGLDLIVTKQRSKESWLTVVGSMTGEYQADIPDKDVDVIVDYLGRYAGENNPVTAVPMDVNRASADALKRLRFLSGENIQDIVERRSKNEFRSIDELRQFLRLDQSKFDLATTYLQCGK